ncbi:hypothetical protein NW759_013478 [Fusarium solani]|nr:hypothetical protein NW759_013478 [Fusarium solani]
MPFAKSKITHTIEKDRIFDEEKLQSALIQIYGTNFQVQKNVDAWVVVTNNKSPKNLSTKLQLDGVIAM